MQSKTVLPPNSPDNPYRRDHSDEGQKTQNVRSQSIAKDKEGQQNNHILLITVSFLCLGWLTTLALWSYNHPNTQDPTPQDFLVATLHQRYCQDIILSSYTVDLDELLKLKPDEEFKWRVLLEYCFHLLR